MELWRYRRRAWARKAWLRWYSWAIRSRLEPIKKVARMIKRHLEGILTAVVLGVTNARAEGLNAKIQWIKATARGFRNRDRFRDAIYFHLGGLDLYPAALTR
jgi:transposase